MTRRARIVALAAALVAFGSGAWPLAGREADPFYLGLLRDGVAAAERGDAADAAVTLRLACFGLLEEPRLLAQGLVHLALAQAKIGDAKAFRATYNRVAEIEARFGAYGQAQLAASTRAAFAAEAAARVPPATLAATPAFAQLAKDRLRQELAKLSPRQRRKEIERRLEKDPGDPILLALRAEMDPRAPKPAPASAAAKTSALAPKPATAVRAPPATAATPSSAVPPKPAAPAPVPGASARPAPTAPPSPAAAPAAQPLPAAAQAKLEAARDQLAKARTATDLAQASRLAKEVADAHPQAKEAQFLAAEIAYRGSRHAEVVHYFNRGGDPGDNRPTLLFYLAVAQYETGAREAARRTLERCLARIAKTPFVERYTRAILGPAGGS